MEKRKRIVGHVIVSVSALVIISTLVGIILWYSRSQAAPKVKPVAATAAASQFKFTGATGWWQGATNLTSMAVFQDSHDCFVSAEYKPGTVDVAVELQKIQSDLTKNGYVVTPGGTQTLMLQTISGSNQYVLYQSSVVTPAGASKVEGGQEFGYLQQAKGYVKIMGYCNTAEQLPTTIAALEAIKYSD